MAKTIASLIDGRVGPWYSDEDSIPEGFVVVPEALLEKYRTGEIADGKVLARTALAQDAEVGTAHQNVAMPLPPDKAKGGDADPGAVDPATIPQGEPTQHDVTHFSTGRTRKA